MKSLNRVALSLRARTLLRRKALTTSIRPFSSSQQCSAYFPPPFEPTPYPQLDEQLEIIRRQVLLPRHLQGDTKKLVSNEARSQQLRLEDVRVKIGNVEEQLLPHNYATDGVAFHAAFLKVLGISVEHKDFSVWPQLLKGFDGAKLMMKRPQREKLARKMAQTGNLTMLLDLLDSAKHSEYRPPASILTIVPHSIRSQALAADYVSFAEELLSKADGQMREAFSKSVAQGRSSDDLLSKIPGLAHSKAQALRRGLRRAVRYNLIFSREHQKPVLQQFHADSSGAMQSSDGDKASKTEVAQHQSTVLNDPLFAAVPLELQSRLETLLSIEPDALQAPEVTSAERSGKPATDTSTPSAAEYARRLLSTLEAQPLTSVPEIPRPTGEPTKARPIASIRMQEIWLSRALLVAASLRAASKASTVVKDTTLLRSITKQQSRVDKLLAEAARVLDTEDKLWTEPALVLRLPLQQYRRYEAGLEWGLHGQQVFPPMT